MYINEDIRAHVAHKDTGSRTGLLEENLLDENMYKWKVIQGVLGSPSMVRLAEISVQAPHFKCIGIRWDSRSYAGFGFLQTK